MELQQECQDLGRTLTSPMGIWNRWKYTGEPPFQELRLATYSIIECVTTSHCPENYKFQVFSFRFHFRQRLPSEFKCKQFNGEVNAKGGRWEVRQGKEGSQQRARQKVTNPCEWLSETPQGGNSESWACVESMHRSYLKIIQELPRVILARGQGSWGIYTPTPITHCSEAILSEYELPSTSSLSLGEQNGSRGQKCLHIKVATGSGVCTEVIKARRYEWGIHSVCYHRHMKDFLKLFQYHYRPQRRRTRLLKL